MTEKIVMRAHLEDVTNIKLAAMNEGLDVSTFLRQLLIRNKIISPV